MSRLEDIEARLKAAMPGPWRHVLEDNVIETLEGFLLWTSRSVDVSLEQRDANARLIAHAPADIAALLEVARAAEAIVRDGYACTPAQARLAAALEALGCEQ